MNFIQSEIIFTILNKNLGLSNCKKFIYNFVMKMYQYTKGMNGELIRSYVVGMSRKKVYFIYLHVRQ